MNLATVGRLIVVAMRPAWQHRGMRLFPLGCCSPRDPRHAWRADHARAPDRGLARRLAARRYA